MIASFRPSARGRARTSPRSPRRPTRRRLRRRPRHHAPRRSADRQLRHAGGRSAAVHARAVGGHRQRRQHAAAGFAGPAAPAGVRHVSPQDRPLRDRGQVHSAGPGHPQRQRPARRRARPDGSRLSEAGLLRRRRRRSIRRRSATWPPTRSRSSGPPARSWCWSTARSPSRTRSPPKNSPAGRSGIQ